MDRSIRFDCIWVLTTVYDRGARDLTTGPSIRYNKKDALLLSSSMVEHPAVNRRVVGSSPTSGANSFFS